MKDERSLKAPAFPAGHFYSPVVDVRAVTERRAEIWPERPEPLGIDFNDDSHRTILCEVFPRHIGGYDYPQRLAKGEEKGRFYNDNPAFSWLDSRALFVLLREWRPRRLIEVGGGFSTLLVADVNTRFLSGALEVSCIEPHPPPFLERQIPGLTRLLVERVERIELEFFARLGKGDVLFIDSSHVAKTGSDVNFLLFEVLPRLKPGVRIHIHDVFLPHDYPEQWVLQENRSWNEQYVVRALLMYSSVFRVVFSCTYAFHRYPELVSTALGLADGRGFGGGSLWLERLGDPASPRPVER